MVLATSIVQETKMWKNHFKSTEMHLRLTIMRQQAPPSSGPSDTQCNAHATSNTQRSNTTLLVQASHGMQQSHQHPCSCIREKQKCSPCSLFFHVLSQSDTKQNW
ncbi:hypothetical protein E2C01_009837 [Portunus trituberculatus]|uniref:Uncharacterized protein n=1 Tax=Portunus trituberculatus TaxID=210409 RepID=A0A5B7D721_PORTR|nr:hypothetical protein [Portunus trituberculatus]